MEFVERSPLPVPLAGWTMPSPNKRPILELSFFERVPQIK
jgi:hypothetical protein